MSQLGSFLHWPLGCLVTGLAHDNLFYYMVRKMLKGLSRSDDGLRNFETLRNFPRPHVRETPVLCSLHLAPLWQAGEGAGEGPGHRGGWKAWHVGHREQCSGEGDGESGSGRASERGTQMMWAQLLGAQGVGRSHFIVIRNSLIPLPPSRGRGYPGGQPRPSTTLSLRFSGPTGPSRRAGGPGSGRGPYSGRAGLEPHNLGSSALHTHLRAGHASVAFPASHESKSQKQLWGWQTGPTAAIVLY